MIDMDTMLYIFIAFAVSLVIRVLPLTLIRHQIESPFLRSFLYYVPYVTLSVMTFPSIINSPESPVAGFVALIVSFILAFRGANLLMVAGASCLAVLFTEMIL